jgi:hypothetical protein
MGADAMAKKPGPGDADPWNRLDRRIIGTERAQIRVPCDLPERIADIQRAVAVLASDLAAISQMQAPARTKALAMRAAVLDCEAKMQRIGKGRFQPDAKPGDWR